MSWRISVGAVVQSPHRFEPPHHLRHRPDPGADGARIRSTFAPPDAQPRGTRRNRKGRRVTGKTVGRPFAHVMANDRDQAGTRRELRGAAGATCKIAGIAYDGPLNFALAPNSVRVDCPGRSTCMGRYGLNGVNCDSPSAATDFSRPSTLGRSCSRRHYRCGVAGVAAVTGGRWHQGSEAPPSLA
jgi:hypothetical protein